LVLGTFVDFLRSSIVPASWCDEKKSIRIDSGDVFGCLALVFIEPKEMEGETSYSLVGGTIEKNMVHHVFSY